MVIFEVAVQIAAGKRLASCQPGKVGELIHAQGAPIERVDSAVAVQITGGKAGRNAKRGDDRAVIRRIRLNRAVRDPVAGRVADHLGLRRRDIDAGVVDKVDPVMHLVRIHRRRRAARRPGVTGLSDLIRPQLAIRVHKPLVDDRGRSRPGDLPAEMEPRVSGLLRPVQMRRLIKITRQENRRSRSERDGHSAEHRRDARATGRLCRRNRLRLGRQQAVANVIRLVGIGRQVYVEQVRLLRRRKLQLHALAVGLDDRIPAEHADVAVEAVVIKAQHRRQRRPAAADFLQPDDVRVGRGDDPGGPRQRLPARRATDKHVVAHHAQRRGQRLVSYRRDRDHDAGGNEAPRRT